MSSGQGTLPFGRRGAPARRGRSRFIDDNDIDDPYSYRGGASRGRNTASRSQRAQRRTLKKFQIDDEDNLEEDIDSNYENGASSRYRSKNQTYNDNSDEELTDQRVNQTSGARKHQSANEYDYEEEDEEDLSNMDHKGAGNNNNDDEEEDLSHSEIEDDCYAGRRMN